MTTYIDHCVTPIGKLLLAVDAAGCLRRIEFAGHHRRLPGDLRRPDRCAHVALQLREYFAGTRLGFDLDCAPAGTEFQRSAWLALQSIPFGQTSSYEQQAGLIGRPRAVRAIGAANGKNPIPIVLPCHRVIGKNGALVGFGGGLETKRFLLEHESRVLTRQSVAES